MQSEKCPIETTLAMVGNKWKILILRELFRNGKLRFSQLAKQAEGISDRMLSQTLKQMQSDGIVERTESKSPIKVEYSLTSLGRSLRGVMSSIYEWGTSYLGGEYK